MGLPMILAAAGTAMNVVGALKEGQSASQNYAYQAQVAKYNADASIRAGEIDATTQGMKTRAQVGAIKAGEAAAGVDVNSGSAADVAAAQEGLGTLDALTIRSNAAARAFGFRSDANMLNKQSGDARSAGFLKATSSLIGGAADTYGKFADWQRTGAGLNMGIA